MTSNVTAELRKWSYNRFGIAENYKRTCWHTAIYHYHTNFAAMAEHIGLNPIPTYTAEARKERYDLTRTKPEIVKTLDNAALNVNAAAKGNAQKEDLQATFEEVERILG